EILVSPLNKGSETILIAEDSPEVRDITKEVLVNNGYKVIEAFDGVDAINKFNENKDTIDLLLFDVIMPRKNGKEAYDEIKKIKPSIKALFISGYATDILSKRNVLEDNINFISKPILPNTLLKKIREILDNKTS
ncbi:MAG: response regulator, partial [Thermodesulfovibrionales bacterium]|nr:response regulator [Thermodesulfovibrionales bacterium]